MVPRPRGVMRWAASRPTRNPPKQAISQILRNFVEDSVRMLSLYHAPTLNIATSTGPYWFSTSSKRRFTLNFGWILINNVIFICGLPDLPSLHRGDKDALHLPLVQFLYTRQTGVPSYVLRQTLIPAFKFTRFTLSRLRWILLLRISVLWKILCLVPRLLQSPLCAFDLALHWTPLTNESINFDSMSLIAKKVTV